MTDLTSTQAFWLGHLFHASSRQLALSEYAVEQRPQLDADRYRVTQPGAGAPGHRRRTGKTGGLNDLRGDRFLDSYRFSGA